MHLRGANDEDYVEGLDQNSKHDINRDDQNTSGY